MNKIFKTPAPLKEFAKKIKRQSLMSSSQVINKRRSTTVCESVTLDDEFLAKLRSIPDANVCYKCHEYKETQKLMLCRCQQTFHPSCIVDSCDANVNEIIKTTVCPLCGLNLDISELMFVYAENCITSNKDILKNDSRIRELERQLELIQKEYTICKSSITKISQQRDISKKIWTTAVSVF